MLTQQSIVEFCSKYNYDIRVNGNGRWIDQKCSADVVTVIADCIWNYEAENPGGIFTTLDIWHHRYAVENIEIVFKKPGVESTAAKNEYDKFFQQPMEMLANAQVLTKIKKGTRNFYRVSDMEILEYIALREKNSLFFLKTYIEKVLTDSGLIYLFDNFFRLQTKEAYNDMKLGFSNFTINNTKINGVTECNRIFIKVLNPLAYFRSLRGTKGGHLSEQAITYDMLMYNRNNFRDIYADKPKGITRREHAASQPFTVNEAYYRYQSAKAKKFLKLFNNESRGGQTEHIENRHIADKATHIHHIFPEAEFPEICYFLENLIVLTPTQHLNYAHPDGRTREINEQYQHLLLLSKVDRIYENLTDVTAEHIYEFENLLFVINVGFDNYDVLATAPMDFGAVVNAINVHYIA